MQSGWKWNTDGNLNWHEMEMAMQHGWKWNTDGNLNWHGMEMGI